MIRVLHVVSGMDRGGIETFIMNVYRNMNRDLIQFDFLVHTLEEKAYDKEILSLGGKIYRITPRSKGIRKNRRELNSFFKENKHYNIVHHHVSSLSYIEPLKAAKRNKVENRLVHGHSTRQSGHWFHRVLHMYNKVFIKQIATEYFACSDLVAKWIYPKNMVQKNKIIILKNGIDIKKYLFDVALEIETRKELMISSKFVIGHVGRFSLPKNHEFLIDIFSEVLKKNKDSVLLLVGEGELEKKIKNKVKEKKIGDQVIFAGSQSDIPKYLSVMDVFVFPSIYEGLPISLVEAQSAGLKCVISDSITDEVIVTNLIDKLSLNDNSRVWVEKILENNKTYKRSNYTESLQANGYDIKSTVNYLKEEYLSF